MGRLLSRRDVLSIAAGLPLVLAPTGCLALARLFVAPRLAAGVARAGMLGASTRFGAVRSVAPMATYGRAASVAYAPAPTQALKAFPSVELVETPVRAVSHAGRTLGHVLRDENIVRLRNPKGQTVLSSERTRSNIDHFQADGGRNIGRSRVESNGNEILHYSETRQFLGRDIIHSQEVRHFDHGGNYIGATKLRKEAGGRATELFDADGIGLLVEAYSASIVFSDDNINRIYTRLREAQTKCFGQSDESACDDIKFIYAELLSALQKYA